MFPDCYVAEFANALSAKKRPRGIKLASRLGVRITNKRAKMQTADQE